MLYYERIGFGTLEIEYLHNPKSFPGFSICSSESTLNIFFLSYFCLGVIPSDVQCLLGITPGRLGIKQMLGLNPRWYGRHVPYLLSLTLTLRYSFRFFFPRGGGHIWQSAGITPGRIWVVFMVSTTESKLAVWKASVLSIVPVPTQEIIKVFVSFPINLL